LQRLRALVLRRRQLVQMITSERQRMRISHVAARPSVERVIGKTAAQAFASRRTRWRSA
jgi:hypothetical protein